MVNQCCGLESDPIAMRVAGERYLIIADSAQPVRDADWITRHVGVDELAVLMDASALTRVISVMGPSAADLIRRVSP